MGRVLYQPSAEADLVEVWSYIAQGDLSTADEYVEKLQSTCELIAEQPGLGVARPDIAEGVRAIAFDNYIIYYEAIDGGIAVLRVWHAARDPAGFEL